MDTADRYTQLQLGSTELPEINDYNGIAPVYDQVMGEDIAEIIFQGYLPVLRRCCQGQPVRHLDLACGTGSFLRRVAWEFGPASEYHGIDLSSGQIAQAVSLTEQAGLSVQFTVGDVLQVEFPPDLTLVSMNLDALNHLRQIEDWQRLLVKVWGSLRSGGHFLFDINTQDRLRDDLMRTEVILKPNLTYVQCGLSLQERGSFLVQQHLMQIFYRHPEGVKEYTARIQQMAPTRVRLMQLLRRAGFSRVREIDLSAAERRRHIFLKNRLFVEAIK